MAIREMPVYTVIYVSMRCSQKFPYVILSTRSENLERQKQLLLRLNPKLSWGRRYESSLSMRLYLDPTRYLKNLSSLD